MFLKFVSIVSEPEIHIPHALIVEKSLKSHTFFIRQSFSEYRYESDMLQITDHLKLGLGKIPLTKRRFSKINESVR